MDVSVSNDIIYCCKVPSCMSAFYRGGQNSKRFYRFSKDLKLRELYKEFCEVGPDANCDNYRVCEDHFDLNDFVNINKIRLNRYAYPKYKTVQPTLKPRNEQDSDLNQNDTSPTDENFDEPQPSIDVDFQNEPSSTHIIDTSSSEEENFEDPPTDIDKMEVTSSNRETERLCWACLSSDVNLKEIPQIGDKNESFVDVYKTCTSIDLRELGQFYSQICTSCWLRINDFYTFREKCIQAHNTIKTMLGKSTPQEKEAEILDENNSDLEMEQSEEDNVPVSEDKVLKCLICCKDFDNEAALNKHTEIVHCTNDYKCSICHQTFIQPTELNDHIKSHSNDENYRATKKYQCNRCDISYKSLVNLQVHMYSHIGIRPFKCKYCQRTFTKQYNLNVHLTMHTGAGKYLCYECGKRFSSSLHLERHNYTHSGIRPYNCKLCPRTFISSGDLKVHIRTHTGETPYLCSTCGKSFKRISHLNVHKRVHTGEKPFQCSVCSKGFAQSGDLKAHERIHTGERPYICGFCQKRFNQASGLSTHVKIHMERTFSCVICSKKFPTAAALTKHALAHGGA